MAVSCIDIDTNMVAMANPYTSTQTLHILRDLRAADAAIREELAATARNLQLAAQCVSRFDPTVPTSLRCHVHC